MARPAFVEALLRPSAYPPEERPRRVDLAETHISWLFFAGPFVYKVKKPVDLGFLDFTTPEKRLHFCQEEVRLNRRLSPHVYLGVVEVREEGGRYTLGGPGRTVDYAVKMRRLPPERSLASLLRRGEATPEHLRRVAERLWAFHQGAERGEEVVRLGGLEVVRTNIAENFEQTRSFIGISLSPEAYDLVRAYTLAFLEAREEVFRRREGEGWVRDGHGDLHCAQVFLTDGVEFIDCIEFNARFRYGDVASDLAFLAMDLDFFGRPDLSRTLVDAYVSLSEEPGLLEVLDFYRCYRAYVRGKVESFRLGDPSLSRRERKEVAERARRYFELSASYARPRPFLMITTGLLATGKSAVAGALAPRLGAVLLSSDRVRKERASLPPWVRRPEPWGQGLYSPEAVEETYRDLLERACRALGEGRAVILDASFSKARWREGARQVAREAGVPFLALETYCPDEVALRRLEARTAGPSVSDAGPEHYEPHKASFEPLTDLSPQEHIAVETVAPLEEVAFRALKEVLRRLLSPA